MSKKYDLLPTAPLKLNINFSEPPALPELIKIDDPALDMLNKFKCHAPVTILGSTTIKNALIEMKAHQTHLLFVVDAQNRFIGTVSSESIHGERPFQIMEERRIKHSSITTDMVMMSAKDLLILDVESLTNAKIGQLVETLKFYKRHYALVSEKTAPDDMQLIGYFSASAICKRLGVTPELQNDETAENIIELQRLLKEFD